LGIVTSHRLGDEHRVLHRVEMVLENDGHLLRGLEEELIAGVAHPLSVVDRLAGADAEQNVVRLRVALPQVVHVVGRHERQVELFGQWHEAAVDDQLLLDPLILHLEEEVVLPHDVAEPRGRFERRPGLLDLECARDFTLQATAQRDQSRGVLRQQFLVDARR
jgi:hypothetical protein